MKFKRLNIVQYAKKNKVPYMAVDLLKQTSIEWYVKYIELPKEKLKALILRQVGYLLDEIIKEEKLKWAKK